MLGAFEPHIPIWSHFGQPGRPDPQIDQYPVLVSTVISMGIGLNRISGVWDSRDLSKNRYAVLASSGIGTPKMGVLGGPKQGPILGPIPTPGLDPLEGLSGPYWGLG